MLHAAQPWLPLLEPGPDAAAPPPTRPRRRQGCATSPTSAATEARTRRPPRPEASHAARRLDPRPALDLGHLRALRYAVLGLVVRWDLTGPEALTLLGEPLADEAERTERMQALARVSRSLLLLLPERERCRAFLRAPCPALGEATPLGLMLAEGALGTDRVAAHLAERARRWNGGRG